ncbi:MAG: AAA family ATPase [Promethearchaeota archaeon]
MVKNELQEIEILIRARYPLLYIISSEEFRVLEKLGSALGTDREVFVWSFTKGFRKLDELEKTHDATCDPVQALAFIMNSEKDGLFVLCDFHHFMIDQNPEILRFMREMTQELKKSRKNCVILAPYLKIPNDLEKEITVIDFPTPNRTEIEKIFKNIYNNVKHQPKLNIQLTADSVENIVKALMGLTQNEIENVLLKSLVATHTFSVPIIIGEKEQIIKKTGILEYFFPDEDLSQVGGLQILKDWMRKRKLAFTDRAREFGLPTPKGLLLLGIQGCGKSLCCKVVANLWKFPLLRLDMGAIFQGIVGSSENNMRKAISLAESISPCILWIDEIEKGFSGVKSSNVSDAGTTARVFATFLTWMQEKHKPVFIIATANDVTSLPPELLRKGRFDEIFFVDLPSESERREIFKIHLKKRNRNPDNYLLDEMVFHSENFSGSEIESAIISAMYDAYDDHLKNKGKGLEQWHIIENLNKTIPLAETMKENIDEMRRWAESRARPASKKKEKQQSNFAADLEI